MTSLSVLLVDDEKPFLEALAQRLQARGLRVTCAFSGTEALKRLEDDDTIDVVVLDLNMPDPGGIEAVNVIKKKHPLVEIIILTGHATIQSAVESVASGAFDYLSKPCDIDDLVFKAEQAASRKKEREARLFEARTKPYISDRERKELIKNIFKNSD